MTSTKKWGDALPRRAQQQAIKREALLRHAALAFNRRGYHGASLDDIAGSLGVTRAALYRYVESKQELLYLCHSAAMDAAFKNLDRASRAPQDGSEPSGLDKLRGTLTGYLDDMIGDLGHGVALFEENALEGDRAAEIMERRDQFERALRTLVRQGMADGSVVACEPKLAVFALLGAINWVPKWYRPGGDWQSGQIARALGELITRALAAEPAQPALPQDIFLEPPNGEQ
ncbi:MAG: TetR/AcrR family transcriptional regulator [Alphaproteobacteria bacterium]|nr:TetR/AcrR family transcriptional regulator [Alphaproteobacteria bacterium]